MRICILTHTFPRFEGDIAAPFMYGVAKGMVEAGNEVTVLTPYNDKFAWNNERLPFNLVTYKYIWPSKFHKLGYSETLTNDMGFSLLMWILSPFMYISAMLSLYLLIKREKIDIINAHWILPNGFIASAVSLFTGIPVVSTLPGSDVYMVQKNPFFNLLGRFATWKSKWITSNSGQLIKDLAFSTNMNLDDKSSTIIYGVDPSKFKKDKSQENKLRKELGINKKKLIVLGVGRLVAKKGFRYLIEASKIILKRNKNVIFVVVGDGDERSFLENLAKKLKVDKNFRFVGSIDYKFLIHYYNLADIFILPSVRDERGNLDDQSVSVVEAMSCGTPVVTTDFPGYKSTIKEGKTGFLTPEKNSKEIAKKINYLIGNKKERISFGKSARSDVILYLSWRGIGKKYTQLFENITQKYYSIYVPKTLDEESRIRASKQIWRILGSEINSPDKLTCLDVGTSSGIVADFLASYFKSVVAVDIDENAINLAKNRFKKKNLSFEVADIEKMRFKDNSFDIVICNQVYNFVDNPKKLMNEIHRVLKPNGICFFGARNKLGIIEPQYDIPFGSWFSGLLPYGKNYMTLNGLRKLTKNFIVEDITLLILKNPKKYGFKKLEKYSFIFNLLPLNLIYNFIPNYIWLLKKA